MTQEEIKIKIEKFWEASKKNELAYTKIKSIKLHSFNEDFINSKQQFNDELKSIINDRLAHDRETPLSCEQQTLINDFESALAKLKTNFKKDENIELERVQTQIIQSYEAALNNYRENLNEGCSQELSFILDEMNALLEN